MTGRERLVSKTLLSRYLERFC